MKPWERKKCNNCGAMIPRDAAYCDICGALNSNRLLRKRLAEQEKLRTESERPETIRTEKPDKVRTTKSHSDKKRWLVALGIFFAWVIIRLFFYFGYNSFTDNNSLYKLSDMSDWEVIATAEKFEKMDVGMTYDEIKAIMGGDGVKIYDSDGVVSYRWPGEYYEHLQNDDFCYLEATFSYDAYKDSDGEVHKAPSAYELTESELYDGEKAYETFAKIEENRDGELETPIVTKEQADKITDGMTYEEACEILNGDGLIYRAETIKRREETNTTKRYVWRCKEHGGMDSSLGLSFYNGILKYYFGYETEYMD